MMIELLGLPKSLEDIEIKLKESKEKKIQAQKKM